ncbi:MAG: MOSC domain-containing protein [Anaerolineae bacterium]
MQLSSINIGHEQPIFNGKTTGKTGIYKQPVSGPVEITVNGLDGDAICDRKNHGGPDQAIYVYGAADYEWWSAALGQALVPGTFGENLTISNLTSADFSIGDRLRIGPVILEVTAPRIPCVTLAARMGDPQFVRRFRQAERPGLYCRVIQPGPVQAGDPVCVTPYPGETIAAVTMFRHFYQPPRDEQTIRKYLAAPIASRARTDYEAKLQQLLTGSAA